MYGDNRATIYLGASWIGGSFYYLLFFDFGRCPVSPRLGTHLPVLGRLRAVLSIAGSTKELRAAKFVFLPVDMAGAELGDGSLNNGYNVR